MLFGVPLVPFVVLVGGSALLVLWIGPILTWWIVPVAGLGLVPALVWMRYLTRKDDQRFRQAFLAMRLRLLDRNRHFWGARSYAPYPYRGGRDARVR
ncbi:type VI secretion protein [Rubrivivax gelatinosus]|uniref:Type VI secretion protein n=2 Tax=Rubrivivax gelatinosus TaxID=28068 RepID=A0ABS1DNI2_RUBGE|nr:type VI secretion protein [Rubrivivax gelatinosus]MBK1711568.1 type VI secretion protein [Rubrivivax gelatinosus]